MRRPPPSQDPIPLDEMTLLEYTRRVRKLRQADVSAYSGIPQTRISAIERGDVLPADWEVKALARVLDVADEDAHLLATTVPAPLRRRHVEEKVAS